MSQNIYGNYENVDEKEIASMAGAQIHDNVTLDKIEFFKGESKAGNMYECINITFSKPVGTELHMTTQKIMSLNLDWFAANPLPDPQEDKERTESVIANWNARMKHIAGRFGIETEELAQATSGATSFEDFANKYIALLSPKLDGRKLYLKLMKNDAGYAELPKYGRFLQEMSVGQCGLSFSAKENKILEGQLAKQAIMSGGTVTAASGDLDLDL